MREAIEQTMQRILESRGYVVISSSTRYQAGHVVRDTNAARADQVSVDFKHPLVVIGETDEQDFLAQIAFVGYPHPGAPPCHQTYYRCIAE